MSALYFISLLISAFAALPSASANRNANVSSGSPNMWAQVGYVEVRRGAHMFWWLEPCINVSIPIMEQPLIIWLQGGPGYSSTGVGNFEEVGVYELGWELREHTWAKKANLLFVDSPVGTGFSYVEEGGHYVEDADQTAQDLLTMLKEFVRGHVEFSVAPIRIVGHGYAGKVAVAFARRIVEAVAANQLDINFQ